MLKTYLKLAVRNFWKNKTFSFINLLGLALGLASVIMILSYVRYELSYDKHNVNAGKIFRLVTEQKAGNEVKKSVSLPMGLAPMLKKEFPEIAEVTSFHNHDFEFLYKGESLSVPCIKADTNFFKVFNLPFVYGNPSTALSGKSGIILTEKIAQRLFPGHSPVGEEIYIESKGGLSAIKITGVIKNIPANTHFKGDVIMPVLNDEPLNWQAYSPVPQYIRLNSNATARQVENKMEAVYTKYDFPGSIKLTFQPVTAIHLHSAIPDEPFANSDIEYIYIFSLVAFLILAIGCINYVNLTTARSLQRTKEVGVRKVFGANRKQLSLQFIGESFLFFCTALPVAFFIAALFWPYFTRMLNIEAGTDYLLGWQNLTLILLISVVSGIVSGAYPSLFLARLQTSAILKDWQKTGKVKLGLRKTLIVLQFVISVTLVISTVVIYNQLYYLNNKPLGFNKEYLLSLPASNFKDKADAFKQELKQHRNINDVTIASWRIGQRYGAGSSMTDPNDSTKEMNFAFVDADFDFIKTMQLQVLAGRTFSPAYASDRVNTDSLLSNGKPDPAQFRNILASRSIVISDNTAKALQLHNPVGQRLELGALQGTIIGVIKDFQGLSLKEKNVPLIIRANVKPMYGSAYIRIQPQNAQETIAYIQKKWKLFFPYRRFDFSFADESVQKLYDSEQRLASLFSVFAVLAICIACSGLFSIVALAVQQRTKEIGIRKVLGAGIIEIVRLVSKDFIVLVFISVLIAIPIGWWAMNIWLQGFAYRIAINGWVFVAASLVVLLTTFATISFHAFQAASANPVKSLRTE